MRTKLDEIVEEETAGSLIRIPKGEDIHVFSERVMAQIHRVAERAFRHGVEQVKATARPCPNWRHYHVSVEWDAVQPGPACAICKDGSCLTHPAEEKTTGLGTVNHSDRTGCRCQRAKDAKYPSSLWVCGDDRKGERRKCEAWRAHGRYTRYMRHDNETWTTESRVDRRSGKDRRKS